MEKVASRKTAEMEPTLINKLKPFFSNSLSWIKNKIISVFGWIKTQFLKICKWFAPEFDGVVVEKIIDESMDILLNTFNSLFSYFLKIDLVGFLCTIADFILFNSLYTSKIINLD
jgi:hypothetical protein